MTLVSVLPAAMAAIAIFAGSWHLLVYVRGLRQRKHLYFALACFAIGIYDICSAGAYATTDAASSAPWQRGQNLAMALFSPAFLWFVLSYTRQDLRRFAIGITAYYGLVAAAIALIHNEWILTPEPHPKVVPLPWGSEITYFEMHHGVAEICLGTDLALRLPLTAEFGAADLTPEDLQAQLHKAEHAQH